MLAATIANNFIDQYAFITIAGVREAWWVRGVEEEDVHLTKVIRGEDATGKYRVRTWDGYVPAEKIDFIEKCIER
jgi:hypothetical protein